MVPSTPAFEQELVSPQTHRYPLMDPLSLTDDEIVLLCEPHNIRDEQLVCTESLGRKVIKLNEDVVVKFGLGVTHQEASAQQLAKDRVDPEAVRIPRVYRFIERPESRFYSIGYLMMEKIDGVGLEQMDWDNPDILRRVKLAVNAVNSIPSKVPGSVSGGQSYGCLWSEDGSGSEFHNVNDLQRYLNDRLALFKETIQIHEADLRLCHMDLVPRNFKIDSKGRLCLLDWERAGFYPRYFELWAIQFAQEVMGNYFAPPLLESLKPTAEELRGMQKLSQVYAWNSHCTMHERDEETELIMASLMEGEY